MGTVKYKTRDQLEEEILLLKDIKNIEICSMNELLKKYELAKELVENIEKELVVRSGVGI